MNTGFFIIEGKNWERISYRCGCCKLFVMFSPENQPRAFCCGRWHEYTQPIGFFAATLRREQFRQPRVLDITGKGFGETGTE
ncbi:MAG: hypothetical protein JWO71_1709 [Candidatus Acidoferrum typicum]|nr:hypothetical protein [Candidatus Acidoferrum typicum]